MAQVSVSGVTKSFAQLKALDDVSCEFDNGKFYALLGPSGSGKTTLLRMIAGFDHADSGAIFIDGEPVDNLPVEDRDIGMVFQNYALFPNMNVFDNIAFGLSVRKVYKAEIARRVSESLELVRLEGLDKRKPGQLSGGQRQRVALARALITNPRVLLLDEPLSALDRALRSEMEVELRRIQRDVGITTIFVTHDQEEALTMSDHIGILNAGRMIQEGPPLEVYERPNSEFSARFLGDSNVLRGTVKDGRINMADATEVTCDRQLELPQDIPISFSIRPEKISIVESKLSTAQAVGNRLDGTVISHIFAGNSLTYHVQWGKETVRVFVQNLSGDIIPEATPVTLSWQAKDTVMISDG